MFLHGLETQVYRLKNHVPYQKLPKTLYTPNRPYTSFFLTMGMPTGSPLQLVAFLIIMLGVQR